MRYTQVDILLDYLKEVKIYHNVLLYCTYCPSRSRLCPCNDAIPNYKCFRVVIQTPNKKVVKTISKQTKRHYNKMLPFFSFSFSVSGQPYT